MCGRRYIYRSCGCEDNDRPLLYTVSTKDKEKLYKRKKSPVECQRLFKGASYSFDLFSFLIWRDFLFGSCVIYIDTVSLSCGWWSRRIIPLAALIYDECVYIHRLSIIVAIFISKSRTHLTWTLDFFGRRWVLHFAVPITCRLLTLRHFPPFFQIQL